MGNPSVSVYKGYCLPKDAEDHLVSHGLKNASYTISANDVENDLFGKLVACPFQVFVNIVCFRTCLDPFFLYGIVCASS